jgi:hypothetical protein
MHCKKEHGMDLLTTNNTKILKGTGRGWMTFILHLAPADSSGSELCPKRTPGCTAACLNTAGRGKMHKVQAGRLRKARWFNEDREGFMHQLVWDIEAGIRRAEREDFQPCFRLNGTSDVAWERIRIGSKNLFQLFPAVQFYDYTKIPRRRVAAYPNYHLTFSRAENNDRDVAWAVAAGLNVAMVFHELPSTHLGRQVISADEDDLRFLDPPNVVLGLKAKGRARQDTTGFVL